MTRLSFPLVLLAFALIGCGGEATDSTDLATTPEVVEVAPTEPATAAPGEVAQITLTPLGEQMRYEQTEFTVQPGQTVELTFNNTATNAAMRHNVVILRDEASIEAVGKASMSAAATDYIPASEADRILAYTAMSGPGENVSVTFTAPTEPGTYPYICTFPGHYMMMQGVMRVAG
jgi:azurin